MVRYAKHLLCLCLLISALVSLLSYTLYQKCYTCQWGEPSIADIYLEAHDEHNALPDKPMTLEELHSAAKDQALIFPIDIYEELYSKTSPNCAPYPDIYDLNYHNTYWQRLRPTPSVTVDLFGAYFDDRPPVDPPVVRIIAVMNVVDPKFNISCQMWFRDSQVAQITNVTNFDMIWNQDYIKLKDGQHVGFIISCPLPKNETIAPRAISLVNLPCDRSKNNLRVQNERPPGGVKKDIVVCVKGLDFPFDDVSISFVEFLEANFMFGVDKVVTYNLMVHPNMSKVLDYYIKENKVEVHPYSMPATFPNEPYLRHMYINNRHTEKIVQEVIPYNDCYYKNIHLYKYVVLLDIDEIFVPTKGNNYKEMIEYFQFQPDRDTYFAYNKMFVKNADDQTITEGAPEYLEFLQTITVATNYEKPYSINHKSFFNSNSILTLNNHQPYACVKGKCKKDKIDSDMVQLHHYRKKCFYEDRNKCAKNNYDVEKNDLFLRFKSEFIDRTDKVLKELKLV